MFVSLIQALGVDSTFFIQFGIFLLFYPILSRLLFLPYFKLQNQREKETVERMKQVEKLEEKKKKLQQEYEQKAHGINERFSKMYNEESKLLKESFLRRKEEKKEENKKIYEQKVEALLQEVKEAEGQMGDEVNQLAKMAINRLIS